jgi:signal transduction histidine kinase
VNEPQGGEPGKAELDDVDLAQAELRASRARVISAACAFRRRIERDLHDGAQQDLVALAVNLQLARQLGESDPEAAQELLTEMGGDVEKALDSLRRLAWEVYPSLLPYRGLGESLRAWAVEAPIRTRLEPIEGERYPSDIEEAVYFCCIETLRDLAEVAESATVRLSADRGAIRFEIDVDLRPKSFPQPDLYGARDCLGAVGGTLTVSSEDEQTLRVVGEIPSAAERYSASAR